MLPYYFRSITHTVVSQDSLYALAQRYNTTAQAIIAANPGVDLNTLHIGQNICIWPECRNPKPNPFPVGSGVTEAQLKLMNHMRMLWEQHITWTMLAIISMVSDLPYTELVAGRLLRNPKDFENTLYPFYGADRATRFSALLTEHLNFAVKFITALKEGGGLAAADVEQRWYGNAREIAAFLAELNTNWAQQEWETMFFAHLDLVKAQINDMLTAGCSAYLNLYDEMEKQALMMADILSDGIIKQFPEQFIYS